jgi:hypothetical protein
MGIVGKPNQRDLVDCGKEELGHDDTIFPGFGGVTGHFTDERVC